MAREDPEGPHHTVKGRPSTRGAGHPGCILLCLEKRGNHFNSMRQLCLFSRAPIIKYHKLSVLNNRNFLTHSSGVWKMRSRYQQGWFLMRVVKKNLFDASILVSGGLLTSFVIPRLVDTSPHSLPSSSMTFFPYMCLCPNCSFS